MELAGVVLIVLGIVIALFANIIIGGILCVAGFLVVKSNN